MVASKPYQNSMRLFRREDPLVVLPHLPPVLCKLCTSNTCAEDKHDGEEGHGHGEPAGHLSDVTYLFSPAFIQILEKSEKFIIV